MPDTGDFIRRSRRSAKIAIARPGHLVVFADRGDQRLKSPAVSSALRTMPTNSKVFLIMWGKKTLEQDIDNGPF